MQHDTRAQLSTRAPQGFSWQELHSPSSPNQFIFACTTCFCSCRIRWLKIPEVSGHRLPACLHRGTPRPHRPGLRAYTLEVAPAGGHAAQFLLPALLLVSVHFYNSQRHRATPIKTGNCTRELKHLCRDRPERYTKDFQDDIGRDLAFFCHFSAQGFSLNHLRARGYLQHVVMLLCLESLPPITK